MDSPEIGVGRMRVKHPNHQVVRPARERFGISHQPTAILRNVRREPSVSRSIPPFRYRGGGNLVEPVGGKAVRGGLGAPSVGDTRDESVGDTRDESVGDTRDELAAEAANKIPVGFGGEGDEKVQVEGVGLPIFLRKAISGWTGRDLNLCSVLFGGEAC